MSLVHLRRLPQVALLVVLVLVLVVFLSSYCHAAQELTFRYDPNHAAGVQGVIRVQYAPTQRHPSRALLMADLDFSRVSPSTLQELDRKCPRQPRAYEWHIHAAWAARATHASSSASLADCSARTTGGHYDPTLACGPSSQFVMTKACGFGARGAAYRCTPRRYQQDPLVCEKGDLSGKLGNLELDRDLRIRGQWEDLYFPAPSEVARQWNIVLHPVCGRQPEPRLACAVVHKQKEG